MFEEFMGTKAVSERHSFDAAALDAWLRQHVEDYPTGELTVAQFKEPIEVVFQVPKTLGILEKDEAAKESGHSR